MSPGIRKRAKKWAGGMGNSTKLGSKGSRYKW